MKILVMGASGSGTTTIGNELERTSGFEHLDVDDYYWKKTEPPFQEKIALEVRKNNLLSDFNLKENTAVSGSLVSWGDEWMTFFDLTVFIKIDSVIRMQRLKDREIERYGSELETNALIKQNSVDFLSWAKKYDDPQFEGRSIKVHTEWIHKLSCPILEIDGALSLPEKINLISSKISDIQSAKTSYQK